MEPRGSVTFARDALGLLLERNLEDRLWHVDLWEYAEDTVAHKTCLCEGFLFYFSSPDRAGPARRNLHTSVDRDIHISGVPGGRTGGTAELPALDGAELRPYSYPHALECLTQHAPSVRRAWT